MPDTPIQKKLTDINKGFDALIEDMLACAQPGGGKQLKNMTEQEENLMEAETKDDDSDADTPVAEAETEDDDSDADTPVAVKPTGSEEEKASRKEH